MHTHAHSLVHVTVSPTPARTSLTPTHTHVPHSRPCRSIEVFGALGSVVLIWFLTGILVYEAILRMITPEEVDGEIMFITAGEQGGGGGCV